MILRHLPERINSRISRSSSTINTVVVRFMDGLLPWSIPRSEKGGAALLFLILRVLKIQYRFQIGKHRYNHQQHELENQFRLQSDVPLSVNPRINPACRRKQQTVRRINPPATRAAPFGNRTESHWEINSVDLGAATPR